MLVGVRHYCLLVRPQSIACDSTEVVPTATHLVLSSTAESAIAASPAITHSLCISYLATIATTVGIRCDILLAVEILTIVDDCQEVVVLFDPLNLLGRDEVAEAVTRAEVAAREAKNVEDAHIVLL